MLQQTYQQCQYKTRYSHILVVYFIVASNIGVTYYPISMEDLNHERYTENSFIKVDSRK